MIKDPQLEIIYKRHTDKYFLNTLHVLKGKLRNPEVTMQFFQKNVACLGGINRAIEVLKQCSVYSDLKIEHLPEGTMINPYEPVMHVTGKAQDFIDLETVMLGMLSRMTRVATNVRKCVNQLGVYRSPRPLLFFPARFDVLWNQEFDGEAARTGGASDCSTDAQANAYRKGTLGVGTMPHSLIACFYGDTVAATLAFADIMEEVPVISLVDFMNDCTTTAVEVADAMRDAGKKLYGVRLDTSGNNIDQSLECERTGEKRNGVTKQLVLNVRKALDSTRHNNVKIFVSGGFNSEKIQDFESNLIPVDGYGVGSSCFAGNYDFTADIVKVDGLDVAKIGRGFVPIKHRKALI